MPQINDTVLATSLPVPDICKGFALFPTISNVRAGISINQSQNKLIELKPTAFVAWRISLDAGITILAGLCGPAYATILHFKDIVYDNTGLEMTLDSDITDAGLIFGLSLSINFSITVDTLSMRWIDDGWNSRLVSEWKASTNTGFNITFDLLAILLEIILGKLGKAGHKIAKVPEVFQAVGGSFSIYGSEEDVIAAGKGSYTVSPQLDLPINIIGLLKKFAVVKAVVDGLEKLSIYLAVGPIFSLLIPVDYKIVGYQVDGASYSPVTWGEDGVTRATYSSGAVPAAASQLGVRIEHVAARRFGLKVGLFFDFSFLKVLSLNKQVTVDMPDLLKFGPKFTPITNTLSNKAGSQTLGFDPLRLDTDEEEYEVVFA